MPGPPPPPPAPMAPPPPPISAMSPVKKSAGSGDMRGALLSQIQKGSKLKKVTTVDKSVPVGAGHIAGESSPVKSSRGVPSNKSSPDSSTSSPVSNASSRSGAPLGGFASLTDELQHKLTMKKNKQSPVKETKKESSPPSTTPSNSFVNEIKSKPQMPQSVISPKHLQSKAPSSSPLIHSTATTVKPLNNNQINNSNLSDAIANKSSLFNTQKSQTNVTAPPCLPKISHGKPNLAPKPPPQLSLAVNNNSNINNDINNDSSRKSVARHQSMKSPRSPPIALSPSDNHFNTIRTTSNHSKIQDALNLQLSAQKAAAQRPTNRPPPPPVPNRNIATNLSSQSQSHAKSTTALNNTPSDQSLSAPRRIPNSGSSNNVSVTDGVENPPLPPHRVTSRVPLAPSTPPITNTAYPPEVPRRHSSMRNSAENGGNVMSNAQNNRYPSPNPNQPITRLVVDLEARYSLLFHSLSEFPPPKPFMNIAKSYPSQALRPTTNGV